MWVKVVKSRKHELVFISSMKDEKYDQALGGLQTSGCAYLCTLSMQQETVQK